MRQSLSYHASVVLRGMAMGAADVIPGVSGGTIAFITGIYTDLIDSLRRCDHQALLMLFREGVPAAWRHINGNFLVAVFGGILISVFSLANVVTYLLDTYPVLVWSFFFGLILASSIHLLKQIGSWNWQRAVLLLAGLAAALAVSSLVPTQLPESGFIVFAAGAIAICAMILPGISGGFLLLMMGMYSRVVEAISALNFGVLIPFALGCGVGLLAFSHLLGWLLHRYQAATMAFLTGVLIGSLKIIWPWKEVVETMVDRHGEVVPLVQSNVSPFLYSEITGNPSYLYPSITLCVVGVLIVLGMEYGAKRLGVDKN